jgi:hypothetical protein
MGLAGKAAACCAARSLAVLEGSLFTESLLNKPGARLAGQHARFLFDALRMPAMRGPFPCLEWRQTSGNLGGHRSGRYAMESISVFLSISSFFSTPCLNAWRETLGERKLQIYYCSESQKK